jgi:trk system potassium uptake protein TrkH
MYKSPKLSRPIPRRLILFSIPIVSLICALILLLPACNTAKLSFFDTLFTSVSALCVNGLTTTSLSNFTDLGQFLILIMMQIGGLGIITITLMVIASFVRTGLSTQIVASQILEIERYKDIKILLVTIICFTFIIEIIGAGLLFLAIKNFFPLNKAIFYAFFHSVSAFCNAGLSIFPEDFIYANLNNNLAFLSTAGSLILIGSLGFITWHEIIYFRSQKHNKLSLNSKLVLFMVAILVTSFTLLFLILEHNNSMLYFSFGQKLYNSFFNAIAMRGSGLLSIDALNMQPATLLLLIISSFIGASPGSTGGGIKTSAFIIFLATARTAITNRNSVEIRRRRIPNQQVLRALIIITMSIAWVLFTTFCLLITEPNFDFLKLLFEANSAFSMFGISLGVTPQLSIVGKIIIMISMIFGRIGSLTLVLAFVKSANDTQELSYPEEKLMLS